MDKKNPTISVVVPVYNMGMYVERAVNCLLEQEYSDYEIILVDDGSTDDGAQICDRLAAEHDIISVIHKSNGGLSSARNAGMDAARGKYVIFPDPDDWTDKNYLSVLVQLHEKNGTDLEICGNYITEENKEVVHNATGSTSILNSNEALKLVMRSTAYCGFAWNKLYHLDIIGVNKLAFDTELGMAQDLHFAVRYMMKCDKIAYDPTPVYHYFQHAGGVTNTNMPLTKRKISGLQTYLKIAAMTEKTYPKVAAMAYATLCNMCVHFMYIYFNNKMDDPELLNTLRGYVGKYKQYFYQSDAYGTVHRLLFRIAAISPKLYYTIKSSCQIIRKG